MVYYFDVGTRTNTGCITPLQIPCAHFSGVWQQWQRK